MELIEISSLSKTCVHRVIFSKLLRVRIANCEVVKAFSFVLSSLQICSVYVVTLSILVVSIDNNPPIIKSRREINKVGYYIFI